MFFCGKLLASCLGREENKEDVINEQSHLFKNKKSLPSWSLDGLKSKAESSLSKGDGLVTSKNEGALSRPIVQKKEEINKPSGSNELGSIYGSVEERWDWSSF